MTSTALLTDHYELTMLDAALLAGTADRRVVFEVFTRSLPPGRRYGVFAGLGRMLDALEDFRFGADELEWLAEREIVGERTLEWLSGYRFSGDIHSYPEGEIYTAGSPVVSVCGTFAEAVLLETLVLSILNHDSAVAAAASLITAAAGDRPVIEMGSRRTDPDAAVAAARASYIAGLASTSNLEAGRRYGIPTAGTSAHAFVLLFPDERAAFDAQIAAMGSSTTLLLDTYDTAEAIPLAVAAAGPELGAVRIDSGDLVAQAVRIRSQLDSLGAHDTRIIVTGDMDADSIAALSSAPVDGYGAGTSVVMGGGPAGGLPTCGFVYKLVAVDGRPVQKQSPGKETVGGFKWAWRVPEAGMEVVTRDPGRAPDAGRRLQRPVIEGGVRKEAADLEACRDRHRRSVAELGPDRSLTLERR